MRNAAVASHCGVSDLFFARESLVKDSEKADPAAVVVAVVVVAAAARQRRWAIGSGQARLRVGSKCRRLIDRPSCRPPVVEIVVAGFVRSAGVAECCSSIPVNVRPRQS